MLEAQGDTMAVGKLEEVRQYLRQQPVMLALLAGLAILFFLAVTGLSRAYQGQRQSLGSRWFDRGMIDLQARRFDSAVTEFRSALLYSRDNYSYQLNLAEALIGLKRTGEASSYLVNLWDRQPEDGVVNLELARIAVQKGQTEQALRYYHNAIYAAWSTDQEDNRREARLELIEFLLSTNTKAQAQAELIALEENLGDDPSQQQRVGDLFLRAQDYEHALGAYRLSLKADRDNGAALAGAGLAAFQLGRYPQAQHYLQGALTEGAGNALIEDRLKATELVLEMDPFRRQVSVAQRHKVAVEAFETAGRRLQACSAAQGGTLPTATQTSLASSWAKMKPRMTEGELRRDPDLVEAGMDLVFEIERETSATCGTPSGADAALLLIAKLHEGS
jgi:tetratricopeptide (TPR) repeat protein